MRAYASVHCIQSVSFKINTWKINKRGGGSLLGRGHSLYLSIFLTETISRTDEGQPRPKYIFNKCGTNIYFFTLQRTGPSPSPNFKSIGLK